MPISETIETGTVLALQELGGLETGQQASSSPGTQGRHGGLKNLPHTFLPLPHLKTPLSHAPFPGMEAVGEAGQEQASKHLTGRRTGLHA